MDEHRPTLRRHHDRHPAQQRPTRRHRRPGDRRPAGPGVLRRRAGRGVLRPCVLVARRGHPPRRRAGGRGGPGGRRGRRAGGAVAHPAPRNVPRHPARRGPQRLRPGSTTTARRRPARSPPPSWTGCARSAAGPWTSARLAPGDPALAEPGPAAAGRGGEPGRADAPDRGGRCVVPGEAGPAAQGHRSVQRRRPRRSPRREARRRRPRRAGALAAGAWSRSAAPATTRAGGAARLDDPGTLAFHTEVLRTAFAAGAGVVHLMLVEGEVAGFVTVLVDGDAHRLYDGRVADRWLAYRGGTVCDIEAVLRAQDDPDVRTFDWLRGWTEAKFGNAEVVRSGLRASSHASVDRLDRWEAAARRRVKAALPEAAVRRIVSR
ncbi:GNAT family N-acetyltransferase [Nocardioides sp. W3-2-3]|uniref:GNAT family N-acetyltransferase n=1 Tax=Nocardioides convexus TaxID=2712224 RepID=UPI0024187DDA|nr:GNAT family N-acetyltransferase [Nocardioides convexus]NHA01055.1 GNAT family N-acetyltransferase [Nocardioides convexus]